VKRTFIICIKTIRYFR